MSLRPCPLCRRLVRGADSLCPFCAAETPPALEPRGSEPVARRSRAALLVGALAVAGATVGCAHEQGPVAAYGGPPGREAVDAGQPVAPDPAPSAGAGDAGQVNVPPPMPSGPVAMYGAPPPPSHTAAPRPVPTGPVAMYGAAPPPSYTAAPPTSHTAPDAHTAPASAYGAAPAPMKP